MTSAIPLINIEQIVAMAGETTFAKGILLAKAGSVHQLTWQENSASARVTGSHEYQVSLALLIKSKVGWSLPHPPGGLS